MLKFKAIFFCVGLIALAALNPAAAQDLKYVGTTTSTFDGTAGYFEPHMACSGQYRGAVWCTSKMIIENGPHSLAVFPPESGAWVNPSPAGLAVPESAPNILDFSGLVGNPAAYNCGGWQLAAAGEEPFNFPVYGLALAGQPDNAATPPTFTFENCAVERPAACCGGAPNLSPGLIIFEPPDK